MVPKFAAGIRNFSLMTGIALLVVLAFSTRSALADSGGPVKAEGSLVLVETRTLKAVLDRGLIISLVRKSDGRELIKSSADKQQAVQLVYPRGEAVSLGSEIEDRFNCLQINDNLTHVRIESWYGDAVISISTDTATGDLIIEPSGYASRPGLRACRWLLSGIAPGLELVAPFYQGIRMPMEDPLVNNTHWGWPFSWEAGLAILQGEKGGLWIHCQDSRYRYKSLQVGIPGDARCLGFETDAYGTIDNNLSAGGLAWRINVYEGGWEVPAARYRDWLTRAYGLENEVRPQWVKDVRLALSWVPSDPGILDALAKWVKPERVLLHISSWRTDGYDENYPNFKPSEEGKQFIGKAQEMGYHAMPHFNSIDMDPSNPAYNYIRDFQYRDIETKKVQGWSWYQSATKPVPESNAARMRHRQHKTMVKVHPGLDMWRSILAENILPAAEELSLEIVFLDVTLCSWNLHNCLVNNTTPTEGMKRLIALIGSLDQGVVVGGEGRNEITMQDEAFAQVHLFRSSGHNIEGLERLKTCPLNEFMFGKWCRSFGYSRLGGQTPAEELRMKLHLDLGAVPTLTVDSAAEVENPNPAVKKILKLAAE
ncbi:MAG TPA: DUF6259 domain-containing protein [archaeon]|nr:DUF6259 domain-containing protein [archaeon]